MITVNIMPIVLSQILPLRVAQRQDDIQKGACHPEEALRLR
jgi:hypothetical protein